MSLPMSPDQHCAPSTQERTTQPNSDTTHGHSEFTQAPSDHASILRDVIIIGAGPCGLAVAARLCEQTPSAIFTDEEHQRYHWIRKHGRRMSIMRGKKGVVDLARADGPAIRSSHRQMHSSSNALPPDPLSRNSRRNDHLVPLSGTRHYDTLVLDASGDTWMAQWDRLFKAFDITHLRSPMFFHVDPRDRDGLLAYTYEQRRKDELREISGVVGKEVSKHRMKKRQKERMAREVGTGPKAQLEIDERDRKDYHVPSTSLFSAHCACVVDRYGLAKGLIKQESVLDIDFSHIPSLSSTDKIFTLRTDKGVHYARSVVMAVGAGNRPSVPDCDLCARVGVEGMCHSNRIDAFPHPRVQEKIKQGRRTSVLVVGGGLTSAQLDDLAVRRGVDKVWHIMRGDLKVKPFDVNLEWMGKFKNHEKAVFWSADSDADRLEQIRAARNGGSITAPYAKTVKEHQASGRLSLHTRTKLVMDKCVFCPRTKMWRIVSEPPVPGLSARGDGTSPGFENLHTDGDEGVAGVDYIYFATGVASDFSTLPFLQTLLAKHPLHGHGGFPCLSEDLMWRGAAAGVTLTKAQERSKVDGRAACRERGAVSVERDDAHQGSGAEEQVPLFVTGRLASLRLGPGGGNLEGARIGAERIAWALTEIVDRVNEVARGVSVKRGMEGCDICSEDGDAYGVGNDGDGTGDGDGFDGRKLSVVPEEREREEGGTENVGGDDRRKGYYGAKASATDEHEVSDDGLDEAAYRYAVGLGSRYESLGDDDGE